MSHMGKGHASLFVASYDYPMNRIKEASRIYTESLSKHYAEYLKQAAEDE